MAEKASLAKLHLLQRKLDTAAKRVQKIREVADDKVQHLVSATEAAGAAFALGTWMGYKDGKNETSDVFGVPVALGAAVALHGAALFGVGGDMASHLHAFGNGALACAAADFGSQIGRAKATNPNMALTEVVRKAAKLGSGTKGTQFVEGQRLTDEELAALSRG